MRNSVVVFLGGHGQSIPMTDIPEVKKNAPIARFELPFGKLKKPFFAGEWCLIYFYFSSSLPGIFHVALKAPKSMPMTFQVSRSSDLSESTCAKIRLGHQCCQTGTDQAVVAYTSSVFKRHGMRLQ